MPNRASIRIKRLSHEIITAWEIRALKEVAATIHKTSLALPNSLPEFLKKLLIKKPLTQKKNWK
jgi:hypothetical protein